MTKACFIASILITNSGSVNWTEVIALTAIVSLIWDIIKTIYFALKRQNKSESKPKIK